MPGRPVEVVVNRVRDGRTMATREVSVLQDGDTLLVGFASFHDNSDGPDVTPVGARRAATGGHAAASGLGAATPPELGDSGARHWIDRPPPLELRA